jgi:CheY-like chemotaxis protein
MLLRVEDDGRGVTATEGIGVGLDSMRARASELGGTCTIALGPGGRWGGRRGLPTDRRGGRVRVLVVDDHPHYREGLVTALAAIPEVEVVGEAGDGREAVELAAALEPDVVVMDLKLPDLNGIDATREIVARRPATAVLVLTMLEGDDSVFAAMRAGARGYLLKGADRREIARALDTVPSGEIVFSSEIASRVLAWFAAGRDRVRPPSPS